VKRLLTPDGSELARYTAGGEPRIVYGQRVDGLVRVTDRPAGSGGRVYLIERGLQLKSELDGLLADYLAQASRLDAVPMSVCPVESLVG
jgi:hypothetical protein